MCKGGNSAENDFASLKVDPFPKDVWSTGKQTKGPVNMVIKSSKCTYSPLIWVWHPFQAYLTDIQPNENNDRDKESQKASSRTINLPQADWSLKLVKLLPIQPSESCR